jgi:hypothetical protein
MTPDSFKRLHKKSKLVQEIAADYLHLARDADGVVDKTRKARHEHLVGAARILEFVSRIPMSYRYPNPSSFAIAWEK